MRTTLSYIIAALLLTTLACKQDPLNNWPEGSSPNEIGLKVSKRFLASPHGVYGYWTEPHVPYFEVCTWYGGLTFAREIENEQLLSNLISRFDPLFGNESELLPAPTHVDYNVFGAVPFEIYFVNKDKRYFDVGIHYAESQWLMPDDSTLTLEAEKYMQNGYTWQTRLWIDDMYMITMVQAQAFRATSDMKYLNRAAKEMAFYLEKLQRPNGLFYHAQDAAFFWGRGNGWMASGMTELLRVLPKEHEYYDRILGGYKTMMNTLLTFQTESGAWRQLIDDPVAWEESSSTGMFTFAMITGVKNGWLDPGKFGPAARKGWLRLVKFINEDGDVTEVCEGTGKNNNHQYYIDRRRKTGDMHGQAPVLWCATALIRK
jgi:rhamnogalacturonyl hydrolase YesR